MHSLLTVPLRYRHALIYGGPHAVIRATPTGWEVVQDYLVKPGDTVWTVTDLLEAGEGALTIETAA